MERIYFLSGMQRSGSTVLACLLNQHPDIYATPTSPLLDVVHASNVKLEESLKQYTFDYEKVYKSLTSNIIKSFYEHVEKPVIIDKHRGWPSVIDIMENNYGEVKIICTNRSVPEILNSFIKLIEKNSSDNIIDKKIRSNRELISINSRCEYLFNDFIDYPRKTLIEAIEKHKEKIHIVEYDDLVSNPQDIMNKIYEFLDMQTFNHDFNNIENTCKEEKDHAWGIENLHNIRNSLKKTSTPPEEVLGKELTNYYHQFDVKYS